jgi:hypothetical protein
MCSSPRVGCWGQRNQHIQRLPTCHVQELPEKGFYDVQPWIQGWPRHRGHASITYLLLLICCARSGPAPAPALPGGVSMGDRDLIKPLLERKVGGLCSCDGGLKGQDESSWTDLFLFLAQGLVQMC